MVVTSPGGRRLIPGFNSLTPGERLRQTNGPAETSVLLLDFITVSQVIPLKSEWHQVFDAHVS